MTEKSIEEFERALLHTVALNSDVPAGHETMSSVASGSNGISAAGKPDSVVSPDFVANNEPLIAKGQGFLEACPGASDVPSEPYADASVDFLGFSNFSPASPTASGRDSLPKRKSLSPLKACVTQARLELEEFRRRSKARDHHRRAVRAEMFARLRSISRTDSIGGTSPRQATPVRPVTRSQGKVKDIPHVQPRTLEYKSRDD